MVGKYILIEKAYAKVKGSYMNIEGSDIAFTLTGVKNKVKYLLNILEEKIEKKGLKIDELLKNKIDLVSNKSLNEILIKKKEENILYTDEEKKILLENLKLYFTKKELIENNFLEQSDKIEIFKEFYNDLILNLITVGSDMDEIVDPETHFGIYGCHRYHFMNCVTENEKLFVYLWNPHGENMEANNNYEENFVNINEINLQGLKNGNIILSLERFFLSFRRILYQNREEILEMYQLYKFNDIFASLGIAELNIFFRLFGFTYEIGLTFLWLRIFYNKGKSNKISFQI